MRCATTRTVGRARAAVVKLGVLATMLAPLAGCDGGLEQVRSLSNEYPVVPPAQRLHVEGGDPARGRELLAVHACSTCHLIPGERGPVAHVGPPLLHFAQRTNIGGSLPNRPEVLIRFLMNAPATLPGTGMPDLAVNEAEARHVAALLYTLE